MHGYEIVFCWSCERKLARARYIAGRFILRFVTVVPLFSDTGPEDQENSASPA